MKAIHGVTSWLLWLLVVALEIPPAMADEIVLSRHIMELTNYSAYLSALAYTEGPPADPGMDYLKFFDEEPDQALVVKHKGYCYGVFRGTTLTWDDWKQNIEVGNAQVCADDADETTCCKTRKGFYGAYDTVYRDRVEFELEKCAETCQNKDECVVLTGHSQGGAIAAVAGVALAKLNPYVITFGQPATILSPCERVSSARWYRWINTKDSESGVTLTALTYDPVPFVPGLGADFFGHMILMSSDDTGVAYVGLNAQEFFGPLNVKGFEAHNMFSTDGVNFPGYADRISKLMELYDEDDGYPIRANGFIPGSYCTQGVECETKRCERETGLSWMTCVGTECERNDECDTGRCDSGICLPKLGSCAKCDEDSDCASGVCSWRFRCAETKDGLMGDQCLCNINADCVSGRCEGFRPPICEAKLGLGASCNEDSDCISGECSWKFECVDSYVLSKVDEKSGIIIISTIVGLIVIGCMILHCWRSHRRRGYEEIPARLTV